MGAARKSNMQLSFGILLCACAFGAPLLSRPSVERADSVHLPYGTVKGNLNRNAREFLGIPYATSTRFEPPIAWSRPFKGRNLDATAFRSQCIQYTPPGTPGGLSPVPQSEDCLYLNVFTPRRGSKPLPVMAWIHGGGLTGGTAMCALYNGSATAQRQEVVVVTLNYRLHLLGFAAGTSSSISSNNGFRDQLAALQWIQRHIEAFGGDPSRVTIFGESAGGQSVGVQLVSPLSHGLFHAAISQSGDISNTVPLSQRINETAQLMEHVGCADVACLKRVNVSSITSAIDMLGLDLSAAAEGDDLLPEPPLDRIKAGRFHRVPYMLGTNEREGSLFVHDKTVSAAQAQCVASHLRVVGGPGFEGLYPVIEGQDNRNSIVDMVSDVTMHCPNREVAMALDAEGSAPWMYSFKRAPACPFFANTTGAAHAMEIAYVFNEQSPNKSCITPLEDRLLAQGMNDLWGFFAREHRQVSSWPKFESSTMRQVAKLDIGLDINSMDTETGYRRGFCTVLGLARSTFQHKFQLALNDCINI